MALTDVTHELAARVRAEGVTGQHFPIALRLVAHVWHLRDRPDGDEFRWGLAAGNVLDVADLLCPEPPSQTLALDEAMAAEDDQARTAVAALTLVLADCLHQASQHHEQPRAWNYALAAVALRDAALDLT